VHAISLEEKKNIGRMFCFCISQCLLAGALKSAKMCTDMMMQRKQCDLLSSFPYLIFPFKFKICCTYFYAWQYIVRYVDWSAKIKYFMIYLYKCFMSFSFILFFLESQLLDRKCIIFSVDLLLGIEMTDNFETINEGDFDTTFCRPFFGKL
jgi:hypothetical protein